MINFKELPSDGVKFEQLIREILVRSGFEVHWTGVGPDAGRDLIFIEKVNGKLAPFERKWLVSCKHNAVSGQSVGITDANNIIDDCEAVGAEGFLLACSTQPSSAVVKRFEEIESRGKIIVRYWDSIEIEKRLNTPSTLQLIHLFFPESYKQIGWKIYNTYSPAFWAANYKDYFVYLSSRTANTFPELKHVEDIIDRLESIKLPKGDEWQGHYIRPRAIYFDNKHEQFSVFADYLYPSNEEGEVLKPSDINKLLKDGQGLYSESNLMWLITFWDIRYVPSFQLSDHFHLDHKDYYDKFMDNYKTGFARKAFISEISEFDKE
ncbi:restriction endonuclease [Tindallia californiensis]|uniref:Restriction endonuclease n=1 Tax=Tindallia californiensis TaxID=159292 RepID=A0A1H3QSB5_9FIRM|nr:restriction endonuclease [Tindallia californiensis]SDZ16230.1 Restriction endonuclease [Tindallia californiensis]